MNKISDIAKEKNWDSDFGMKIINEYETIPVSKINVNDLYQRSIEPGRLKRITKSMKASGYWPAEIIILNEKLEAVDGNHRVNAARKLGIKKVPCSIVTFPTKKEEIRFFSHKNNWNTSLKPIDAWHARYHAGHAVAMLLYRLESDPQSLMFNFVAIKGKATRATKLSINDSLTILNTSVFNHYSNWSSGSEKKITVDIKKLPYETCRARVNRFMNFFLGVFGKDKRENSIAYAYDSIRVFCRFYVALNSSCLLDSKQNIKSTRNKMKKFVFDSGFMKADTLGKFMYLVTFYNKGLGENSKRRLKVNV